MAQKPPNFPSFMSPQVALCHAELYTGGVLDLTGRRWKFGSDKKTFLVFSSLGEAISYGEQIIAANPVVECNIYDDQGQHIKAIRVSQKEI
jgi:hypothetical protein